MDQAEGIFISKREQVTYQAVTDFLHGKVSRKQTAQLLQMTERSISRIARRVEKKSFLGISHGN